MRHDSNERHLSHTRDFSDCMQEVESTYFPEIQFIDFDQSVWENILYWGADLWNDARLPSKFSTDFAREWGV